MGVKIVEKVLAHHQCISIVHFHKSEYKEYCDNKKTMELIELQVDSSSPQNWEGAADLYAKCHVENQRIKSQFSLVLKHKIEKRS